MPHPDDPAPLIYHQLADERLVDVPTQPPAEQAGDDPPARTAGEQDHSDPWAWAGADADPPGPS